MKANSLENFFSVTVLAKNTIQDCTLCRFPSDLLMHIVSRVKAQIESQFLAFATSFPSQKQLIDIAIAFEQTISDPDPTRKEVADDVYNSLLDLKLGLLSLMGSCYALYSKTRGT
jgi:hypothetical protein